jgi:hypothetical protein
MSHSLNDQDCLHLRWYNTEEGDERTSIFTLLSDVGVNDVPEAHRLQVHLHHKRPFGVCWRLARDDTYTPGIKLDEGEPLSGGPLGRCRL